MKRCWEKIQCVLEAVEALAPDDTKGYWQGQEERLYCHAIMLADEDYLVIEHGHRMVTVKRITFRGHDLLDWLRTAPDQRSTPRP